LGSFGALLEFALELEGAATQFYEEAEAAPGLGLKATEMLLKSFQGLEGEGYRLELQLSPRI